ncbi:MAG: hypothetical protein E7529_03405 [Ruminococcaceae bacterium]|nr:hypothetical protein [Oscillospiraceae bacterium]
MNILGIDIGTTTVTALVLDTQKSEVSRACTLKNDSFIEGRAFEKLQNPNLIIETVKSAVKTVTESLTIDAIGITGQMHGLLYLDKDNTPCSPLMIWQDERGNEPYKNGLSYAEYLTKETGLKAASGFGLTTHFYNLINGEIPENAVMLCTIHDYLASLLTGTKPVTHSSDAASLGFYNLKENCFDENALSKVGIDKSFLPEVIKSTALAGKTVGDFLPEGIPVAVAIGDNQGSFLGSVADAENSVLVNVGTGSQVSFVTEKVEELSCGEIRPLTDDKYIFVGASLCGGRAYAILKAFFEKCAQMLGGKAENLYSIMDEKAESISDFSDLLTVNCQFCGTRENPKIRGSIENIGIENFTPENLILGTLKGVSKELFDMYESELTLLTAAPTTLVCSGNGLRKSEIWRRIFTEDFNMEATLPKHSEEAAVGACVFASVASGIFEDIKSAQNALLR